MSTVSDSHIAAAGPRGAAQPSGEVVCKNHPDRHAVGICVRCRAVVCAECITKVDGVNYCVSCLGIISGEAAADSVQDTSLLGRVIGGLGSAMTLAFIGFLLLQIATCGACE